MITLPAGYQDLPGSPRSAVALSTFDGVSVFMEVQSSSSAVPEKESTASRIKSSVMIASQTQTSVIGGQTVCNLDSSSEKEKENESVVTRPSEALIASSSISSSSKNVPSDKNVSNECHPVAPSTTTSNNNNPIVIQAQMPPPPIENGLLLLTFIGPPGAHPAKEANVKENKPREVEQKRNHLKNPDAVVLFDAANPKNPNFIFVQCAKQQPSPPKQAPLTEPVSTPPNIKIS
eukprot:GDKJ01024068.1.p1 GENE.GDKJ01024068.1~~GDKJ01024068.1.p1  ORF type:complete len:240 (-),score=75.14 GDKJ01024068.1:3-701(-)